MSGAIVKSDGTALRTQGEALLTARQLSDAIECFQRAEVAGEHPDRCSAGCWMAYMLLGDFEAAWRESDAIRARSQAGPDRFWQGECLAGQRVMLRCLHGYGDAVQFLRYAPLLRAMTARLIVEVPPRLVELAQHFDGVDEVVTWGEQAPAEAPVWDVQIEVMELPYIFRTQLSELPLATKYLHLPEAQSLHTRRAGSFRVGLSWTAGEWNPERALPLELIEPIFNVDRCEFWSLAGGPDCGEISGPFEQLLHHEHCRKSIEGLAATIAQLDLVITVDTLVAHVAGALGVRAWVLLKYDADWRWMYDRDDSPWYPSLRLFRQPLPGDWASVIETVCRELQSTATICASREDANTGRMRASHPA